MSESLGPKAIKSIVELAQDYAEDTITRVKKEYSGLGWDQTTLTNEEHRLWFEGMMAQNPNWVLALPYVEGGMAEWKRYARTVGVEVA